MKAVRIGIIGVGNMGSVHARQVAAGAIDGLELAALCDTDAARMKEFSGVPQFSSVDELLRSRSVDAVLIATPHYDHTISGIAALKAGLHVLVEKPISVHKADALRLIQAARGRSRQVFAAMFNQRADPYFIAIRDRVKSGELGRIQRVNWIITNWFRTDTYYASGTWRATWKGEGGGVLLNQCPHNLDLFQWMVGMPRRVRAFCGFGRYHPIEVEDDVTAYMEFASGATAVFVTSTGDAPGTNRLEITGDKGRIIYESDRIVFHRNEVSAREFCKTSEELFARPKVEEIVVPVSDHGPQHNGILRNFTDAIRTGTPLIAPAREGIHSVELANAMLLSAWTDRTVSLPIDAEVYERLLKQRIRTSRPPKRPVRRVVAADLSKSFAR